MTEPDAEITVRPTTRDDIVPLLAILNAIIAAKGTTAFEVPMKAAHFDKLFVSGPDCLLCFTAEAPPGECQGFQALARHAALGPGWGDIGTFTRRDTGRRGVGRALFAATSAAARDLGLVALNATIRADNRLGIPFYERMGFETYNTAPGVPLRDGTPVDRVSKRFLLHGTEGRA